MAIGQFPVENSRRKLILVLNRHDYERCTYEEDAARVLLDDDLYVLPLPLTEAPDLPVPLQNIRDGGLDRSGTLLLQSPYRRDVYQPAEGASRHYSLEKHMYFSQLCQLLGAREVQVDQVNIRSRQGTASFAATGRRLGATAEAQVLAEEYERIKGQMSLKDEFPGGEPDLEAAESLLRQRRLLSDPVLSSLLELRRYPGNQLRSRELTVSLSSEVSESLNVVARLQIPKVLSLKADYQQVAREQCEYELKLQVFF